MIGAWENSFLSQQLNDFLVRLHARPIIKILLNLSKGFMELSSIQSYEPTAPRACPCLGILLSLRTRYELWKNLLLKPDTENKMWSLVGLEKSVFLRYRGDSSLQL